MYSVGMVCAVALVVAALAPISSAANVHRSGFLVSLQGLRQPKDLQPQVAVNAKPQHVMPEAQPQDLQPTTTVVQIEVVSEMPLQTTEATTTIMQRALQQGHPRQPQDLRPQIGVKAKPLHSATPPRRLQAASQPTISTPVGLPVGPRPSSVSHQGLHASSLPLQGLLSNPLPLHLAVERAHGSHSANESGSRVGDPLWNYETVQSEPEFHRDYTTDDRGTAQLRKHWAMHPNIPWKKPPPGGWGPAGAPGPKEGKGRRKHGRQLRDGKGKGGKGRLVGESHDLRPFHKPKYDPKTGLRVPDRDIGASHGEGRGEGVAAGASDSKRGKGRALIRKPRASSGGAKDSDPVNTTSGEAGASTGGAIGGPESGSGAGSGPKAGGDSNEAGSNGTVGDVGRSAETAGGSVEGGGTASDGSGARTSDTSGGAGGPAKGENGDSAGGAGGSADGGGGGKRADDGDGVADREDAGAADRAAGSDSGSVGDSVGDGAKQGLGSNGTSADSAGGATDGGAAEGDTGGDADDESDEYAYDYYDSDYYAEEGEHGDSDYYAEEDQHGTIRGTGENAASTKEADADGGSAGAGIDTAGDNDGGGAGAGTSGKDEASSGGAGSSSTADTADGAQTNVAETAAETAARKLQQQRMGAQKAAAEAMAALDPAPHGDIVEVKEAPKTPPTPVKVSAEDWADKFP